MDGWIVLTFLGGLSLFLYGMQLMAEGLAHYAGARLEVLLRRFTTTPLQSVFVGMIVTALMQSSSAVTVMVVGFVNAGLMDLEQVVGIIMGANIGTTVTAWILGLAGVREAPFWLRLFAPTVMGPLIACIGVLFSLLSRRESRQSAAAVLVGFSILLFGMDTMSRTVEPLAKSQWFTRLLSECSSPIMGLLMGILVTAVMQSSSASVGILQALCTTGIVQMGVVVPMVMGQNIGTCITALLSGIGANGNAKRAALIHLYLNLFGSVFCMLFCYGLSAILSAQWQKNTATSMDVAVLHSLFNLLVTIVFFPFRTVLVKAAKQTGRKTFRHFPVK